MKLSFITLTITLLFSYASAQQIEFTYKELPKIEWASKVVDFSSEYSETERSAKQVLGRPSVLPNGGLSATAWSVKEKRRKELDEPAFIKVGFENPMQISQVAVGENNAPGAIEKIILYGKGGKEQVVYENTPQAIAETHRMLNVFFEKTDFAVEEIELKLQPGLVEGWNQIDAIGICDRKDTTITASINTIPNLKFEEDVQNLGNNINSIYNELAPKITPDGKTIYFVRKNHPQNIGKEKDPDDIWVSKLQESGEWSLAQNIGKPLNNKYSNYVQSVTPDGNTLLLGNVYGIDGSMKPGVSLSNRGLDGWEMPEKQLIENFYNLNKFANYFLTNDNKVLIMAIERKDSEGKLDLYVSFRKDDNIWSEPKNMGTTINTAENDYSPFLAADGVTLYYSTSGKSGYGKEDIFMTKRQDDTWTNWSEPQNLGNDVNTPESDSKYNIPASGEYAYYTSTANSFGGSDIYRIKLPKAVKPNPVVLVRGKVFNERNMKPMAATIIYETLPDGTEVGRARSDPKTGEFSIVLPAGKQYAFRAVAEDFISINQNLDLTEIDEYSEIETDYLKLAPIETGMVVRLNNIFFEYAKAVLKPESFPELNRVIEFLNTSPNVEIEIAGHTDNVGSDATNNKLSKARAQAVADYLIINGVDSSRLIVEGYGERRPIAFNNTEEGRAMNRRVEFTILKK